MRLFRVEANRVPGHFQQFPYDEFVLLFRILLCIYAIERQYYTIFTRLKASNVLQMLFSETNNWLQNIVIQLFI